MVGHCNRKRGVESIEQSGAVITRKMDVDKKKIDKSKRKNAMISSINGEVCEMNDENFENSLEPDVKVTHKIESVNKFDEVVENKLNKDFEMVKLESDVSEDKDANVAEAADEVGEMVRHLIFCVRIGYVTGV
ncbi:hypothetical protein C2G38_2042580 [Gigaspora rosea]|uniref:Uncharacterized protein n=1 Tax=Gigaspora rosea TaxID=44941 RepID=A0A397UMU8_9GLOM|nr:hypothetical protein C2G38_2042580 [Gigaspora rosea]